MATRTMGARSPAQTWALVIGVVYLLVGVVGFFGFASEFTGGTEQDELLVFNLNYLHNIVHIGLGVVWIWAASTHATAKMVNTLFGVVLILVAILGFANVLEELLNIHGSGDPDNYLHVVTGLLSLGFGTLWAGMGTSPSTTPSEPAI